MRNLIYLYVENLGDCFDRQEFIFSSKYKVDYDKETHTLNIKYNLINSEIFFERFNVDKINLIIGENGSGKSTILDALGSTNDFKLGSVNNRRNYKWLAVYDLGFDTNNFILEGYSIPPFKNIRYLGQNKINLNKNLFMQIKATKDNQKEFENIFDYDQVKLMHDELENLVYVYSRLENIQPVINNKKNVNDRSSASNYKRIVSSNPDITDMVDYIDNILANDKTYFRGIGLKVKVFVKDKYYSDGYEIIRNSKKYYNRMETIYGGRYTDNYYDINRYEKRVLDKNQKPRHSFILNYLETIYIRILSENEYEKINLDYDVGLPGFSFENRKKFLLNSIFESISDKFKLNESVDGEQVQGLYSDLINKTYIEFEKEKILNLNNAVNENTRIYMMIIMLHLNFLDSIADSNIITKSEINIPIFQKVEYRRLIQDYLQIMKKIEETNFLPYINLILFDFKMSSLSSGEIQYIKSFSNIYKSIKNIKTENHKSCVILLDEPDMNFHPEWSRRFISTLDEMLGNFKNSFSFQVIITSHSPFMVSDIPKEFITCIHIDQEPKSNKIIRTVTQADFGLMSNVYDLLKESFFMKKPVGELANIFFEHLKKDINEIPIMGSYSNNNIEKIESIIKRIDLVDDPLIKKAMTTFMEEKLTKSNMQKSALLKRKERLERELLEVEYEIRKGNEYD
ncbi:AAA family ATPase [Exiguobacterium sp. s193]|uniref:AAA family ATPase n=1 Tax=Exiguobacterium sp. s193 TaxID=2751207 RepID=UPI0020367035|nr:AAA family ATPase [Exiguobacterium sp. s193]